MTNLEFNLLLTAWLLKTGRRTEEQIKNGWSVDARELCDFLDAQLMGDNLPEIEVYESLKRMKAAILEAEQEYLRNNPA